MSYLIDNEIHDKAIRILVLMSGFFSMLSSGLKVDIGKTSIGIVNLFYIVLILMLIIKSKGRIYINKYKIILITFCAFITCESIITHIISTSVLTKEAMFITIKMVVIALGVSLFVEDKQMKMNSKVFLKGLYISTIVQMVWSWIEKATYEIWNFRLNDYVLGELLGLEENGHSLTFIVNNQLRPSGIGWEPASLNLALVFGYILSKNIKIKILFVISALISTSATGMILISLMVIFDIVYNIFVTRKIKLDKRNVHYYIGIMAVVIIGLIVMYFTTDTLRTTVMRFVNILTGNADSSSNRHIAYYFESVEIIKNGNIVNALFGYGTYMVGNIFSTQIQVYPWLANVLWNPETDFVTILIGNGIIGLVMYYYMIGMIMKEKWKREKNEFFIVLTILIGGITYLYFRNAWILMIIALFCYTEEDFLLANKDSIK